MSELLQLVLSGLTIGAVYGIVAIGFTLIYAASDVVNFAQGEFVMLGGLVTILLLSHGVPMFAAALIAVSVAVLVGVLLQKAVIQRLRQASPVTLIIVTLGASSVIKGVAGLIFDRQYHSLPAFTGSEPLRFGGATLLPQSLWVLGLCLLMFLALWIYLEKTISGKALRACAANRSAAQLVGVNVPRMFLVAFALSAALGAVAGLVIAPITLSRYDIGAVFALKGFSAAIFGGLGNPLGAVVGGLALGVLEALAAGYVTSVYKDGVAFVALILVLLFMPNGIFGGKAVDRV